MTVARSVDLVEKACSLHLLEPAQETQLAMLQTRFPQARALAQEFLRRDWLTAYQINQIFQDRGSDLLLGSYVLQQRLGEGGMGAVFKARNWKLGRVVALKLIRQECLSDTETVQRFRREIRVAAALCHPNIVQAQDADEVGGRHFLVMEYVEGIDLARLVKARGPLPVAEACEYVRQAALGLQHAFEHGLVHRDIKPSNLLLVSGCVKVLDFGLARLSPAAAELTTTLTGENVVMGTPDFMAPEQTLRSHEVDIRADLYSLGCTLYFLLTGQVPFPGGTYGEKIAWHLAREPVPVEQVRPDVPAAVAAVVRKLLAKRLEERYQTPAGLAVVLQFGGIASAAPPPDTILASNPIIPVRPESPDPAEPASRPRLTRRRVLAGAGVSLLVGVGGLALSWLLTRDKSTTPLAGAGDPGQNPTQPGPEPPPLVNPLDRLRPGDIPFTRRWVGQPTEMVGILGAASPHAGPVSCVVFCPDGKYLLSGCTGTGKSAEVRLWNLETLRTVHSVSLGETVCRIAVTSDGKRAAAMGARPQLVGWGLYTGKDLFREVGWRLPHDLQFSPDGRWLLADRTPEYSEPSAPRNLDGTVLILDGETGKNHETFKVSNSPFLRSIQIFKDSKSAVSATVIHTSKEPASISFFEVPSGKLIDSWTFKEGGFTQICLSPDNRYLYGGHEKDGQLWIWDLNLPKAREPILKQAEHEASITSMALSPNGHSLFTCARAEGKVIQWAVPAGRKLQKWPLPNTTNYSQVLAVAPDSRYLAVGWGDGTIYLLRLAT
jgi:serine/threonine protein kinase